MTFFYLLHSSLVSIVDLTWAASWAPTVAVAEVVVLPTMKKYSITTEIQPIQPLKTQNRKTKVG